MRILMVDDHPYYIASVRNDLAARHGHQVDCLNDPRTAVAAISRGDYDVVIADILYDVLLNEFEARRAAHTIRLTGDELLLSGLTVLQAAATQGAGLVILTGGDPLRSLHLRYAYEELKVRVYLSKTALSDGAESVNAAAIAAAERRGRIDPVLNPYLPADGAAALRQTLLQHEARRMIWRAAALNNHTRHEISAVTGLASRTVGNLIPAIIDEDLQLLDPHLRTSRAKFNDLINYAATHWAFFLDEAVRRAFP
jgi:DNA-binding NarL/FixJ family response regulator